MRLNRGLFVFGCSVLLAGTSLLMPEMGRAAIEAAPATSCGVLICDLGKATNDFQAAAPEDQLKLIRGYTTEASRATSAPLLTNLRTFATAAKLAISKSHPDKIVVDAITQLSSVCVSGLSKFSDVNAKTLIDLFRQLSYENSRYDTLNYWSLRIKDIEDKGQLLELARFFSQATTVCTDLEDDDYVVTLSKTSEQTASRKLFRLEPIYEGVYTARVSCADGVAKCPAAQADKVVIMDPLISDNFEVDVIVSSLRTYIYRFTNIAVINGGSTLEGTGRNYATGALSKMHLDYDIPANHFEGYIETADETLSISATIDDNAALGRMFEKQLAQPHVNPVPKELFNAPLVGTYRGKKVSLKVNVFQDDMVGATLSIADLPQLKLRSYAGRFYAKNGLLLLASNPQSGGTLKFALTINQKEGGGYVLEGLSFSTENAVVNPIVLEGAVTE